MPGIGPIEIVILLLVALIVFGPKRLPEMGRSLGRGMREFKDSISGRDEPAHREQAAQLPPPAAEPTPTATGTAPPEREPTG